MPADFTVLNAAIANLTLQVAATEGVEASAVTLINGFSAAIQKAVADAVAADDAADTGTAAAVAQAITDTTARFAASQALLAAVATPPVPASPPVPPTV